MSNTTVAIAFAIGMAITCAANEQTQQSYARVPIVPYDDACSVTGLCEFRARLLKLIEIRNADGVLGLLAADFNEGNVTQRRAFERALRSATSPTWAELGKILMLGGSVDSSSSNPRFCAPYGYTRYPAPEPILNDARSDGIAWVVTAASVPIHAQPDTSSRVIGTVGHELVAESAGGPTWRSRDAAIAWIQVWWRGEAGYIQRQQMWSPNDPHVCLRSQNGGWTISEFRDAQGEVG